MRSRWGHALRRGPFAAVAVCAFLGSGCSGASQAGLSPSDPAATTAPATTRGAPSSAASTSGPATSSALPSATLPSATGSTPARPAPPPTVPAVPGFSFAAAPASVVKAFTDLGRRYGTVVSGVTTRSYTRAGRDGGTLVRIGLAPSVVGNSTIETALVSGIVGGLTVKGATVTRPVLAGQQVTLVRSPSGTLAGWYRAGVVTLVIGGPPADPVVALATGLVKAG